MKTFYKVYFKDFNVGAKIFYVETTMDEWASIRLNNDLITKDGKQFDGNSISFIEEMLEDEESEEKSLAYARSLGEAVLEETLSRQKRNKAPRPIRSIERRANANLALTDQTDGQKALVN